MSLPRIAPVEPPYAADVATSFERLDAAGIPPLGLFRTVAHNPRVLQRLLAGSLLDTGSITLRQREIVILRACARAGCDYEWGVHAALLGPKAGLDADALARLTGPAEDMTLPAPELLLVRTVDALHEHARIPDALWSALSAHYDEAQRIEIVALAGYYRTIAYLCNALRIAPEPFAAPMDAATAPAA